MRHSFLLSSALVGLAIAACSSDDSDPAETASPQTDVNENAPDEGGSTADPAAPEAGDGASESKQQEPDEAPPGSGEEAASEDVALDEGAGGSTNDDGGSAAEASGGSSMSGEGMGGAGMGGGAMAEAAGAGGADMGEAASSLSVFVSTPSDSGGDLGGLAGADATCQALAEEVGAGARTWRAYLSTSGEDARDRIGTGPWINANGITVAADLDELHALVGTADRPLVDLFLDHEGNAINGQWAGSPDPNQHDMLTGSAADGTALAATCDDWTSNTATPGPQVGHSDGLGPGMNPNGNFGSWNSSHAPAGCAQQQLDQVGGAGRFYCFAAD